MSQDSIIAASAYRAYGHSVGNKNYRGETMPNWEDLPPAIQVAWQAATKHILFLAEHPDAIPSQLASLEAKWSGWFPLQEMSFPRTGTEIFNDAVRQVKDSRSDDE
ncbi:hypothetical protein H6G00_00930 [Leptolyngbya sp. FACHB-541]|uniref:hypothetical protein n=1 Tax=Leptolyngbya sp. FACHB-541 TaxID=2692810 RepID=UPI001686C0E7|nr:hypothetical protein [Leptolyngbya sp. FACHB-541]MBD1995192.1 hypothetical protein [Leptolyngbya sp. FACHB-541]